MRISNFRILDQIRSVLKNAFQKRSLRSWKFWACLGAAAFVLWIASPWPRIEPHPSAGTAVCDADGEILRIFLNKDEQWCLPESENFPVPDKLKKAVVLSEDRYFDYHFGINPVSLVRAFVRNLKAGHVESGASTITMQVARLLDPKPRTVLNKAIEMMMALRFEIRHSKSRILRMYLSRAPYGGNIIGFQAASLRYFRKNPQDLTWSECALLAVLPNAPGLVSPMGQRDRLFEKRSMLLEKMHKAGIIDSETLDLAVREPVPNQVWSVETTAPHVCQALANQADGKPGLIRTTLIKKFQQDAEKLVAQHIRRYSRMGIFNGAILAVETKTGNVRAYVGSQDFFNFAHHGQVDGVLAPRSSGSILKPFLYALAMDDGILLPDTRIKDVPSYYSGFSPANADRGYAGWIPAKQALIRSLNVPAVRVLYTFGIDRFYWFLRSAGMSTLFRTPDEYGLPLVLGGAETNLWDMVVLYCGLANNGRFAPLRLRLDGEDDAHSARPVSLISPGASQLVLNILRDVRRPESEQYWDRFQNQWPLAWKTGTSYGQRDAWAVGVSPEWTMAVWMGNFSGEGSANLSGSGCAAPLLFDIFRMLPKDPSQSWFDEPKKDLKTVHLCTETGFLAGPSCPSSYEAPAPKNMKPLKPCSYHKTVYLSEAEDETVCARCWNPGKTHTVAFLEYPPDVAQYLRDRGAQIAALPQHRSSCPSVTPAGGLAIVYPSDNARLWVPRDFDGGLQKVTLRAAHRDLRQSVFWYLDDRYIGLSIGKHAQSVSLDRGWHRLVVVDGSGTRDKVNFFADRGDSDSGIP